VAVGDGDGVNVGTGDGLGEGVGDALPAHATSKTNAATTGR
jgi:hypothetical protein